MPNETYSIADLARLTGVNVRTIRYYLAQGLLPASGESGPGAHYGEGHLDRLRLTKRLQLQHLPLAEIRRRLAELTDPEVAGLVAAGDVAPVAPTTSALEYVRTLLGGPVAQSPIPLPIAPPTPAPLARPSLLSRASPARMGMDSAVPTMPAAPAAPSVTNVFVREAHASVVAPVATTTTTTPAAAEPAGPERSQWERLELSPDIELHVRRPLSRLEQRRVERLITIARQVLKEDMK
jgi:DNA-binding transcriptional MerR regulator